ncbi:MAG: hypothetical protein KF688_12840 [Pirellulales bacterium]|nr:hypothetical protein [Pirellulales bacterium]
MNRRAHRPGVVVATGSLLVLAVAGSHAIAADEGFAAMLADAGIELGELRELADAARSDAPLAAENHRTARQTLRRLRQLGEATLAEQAGTIDATAPGELVAVGGDAIAVRMLPGDSEPSVPDELPTVAASVTIVTRSGPVVVLTSALPRAWRDPTPSNDLPEHVRVTGVLLDELDPTAANPDDVPCVVLATRLQWLPRERVPAGWRWLAEHGLDVSLLDEVRHKQPFVEPRVSREGEAFHACLETVAAGNADELERLAAADIAARLPAIREALANARAAASAANASREQATAVALAAAELERGEAGRSSAAPLFLRPEESLGQFVLVEGIVRRAAKIFGEEGAISHFEIDLYPVDSQNMPIVCCVARLPAGFPLGDAVREQARVAGVFFKLWTYRTRPDADGGTKTSAAPIVIAAEPTWLHAPTPIESNRWAIAGGAAFLVGLAGLWIALWRSHRGERRRPARIEAPPLRLPE